MKMFLKLPFQYLFWLHLLISLAVPSAARSYSDAVDAADDYMERGMLREALDSFQDALSINRGDAYSMQGAATALAHMGRFIEAGGYFENVARARRIPQFYMNAGITYEQGSDFDRAINAYSACLDLAATFRPCHIKIAGLYNRVGNYVAVQQHLQYAINLDPTDFSAYNYLGDTYNNLKHFSLAIDTYKASIPHAGENLGSVLTAIADTHSNRKQYADAKEYYDKAVYFYGESSAPTDLLVGKLFNQLQMGCWKDYEVTVDRILKNSNATMRNGQPSPLSPYRALFLPVDPQMTLNIARSWAKAFTESTVISNTKSISKSDKTEQCQAQSGEEEEKSCAAPSAITRPPLRLAYISRRFEDYPGTQMMLRLFSSHNRSNVHVQSYAHGPDDGSKYRAFIKNSSDYFEDVSALGVEGVTSSIAHNNIDVLVDYDGMHDFNSAKVLLQRPASVQMTWLGFAATTGFSPGRGIEYLIADKVIASPDVLGRYFSERLVYLPGTYQPQDELQGYVGDPSRGDVVAFSDSKLWFDEVQREAVRFDLLSSFGASPQYTDKVLKYFWYMCFNRVEKITPEIFKDWMQILVRRGGGQGEDQPSVLVLMSQSAEIDAQIRVRL